jgi:hypothetical protein
MMIYKQVLVYAETYFYVKQKTIKHNWIKLKIKYTKSNF